MNERILTNAFAHCPAHFLYFADGKDSLALRAHEVGKEISCALSVPRRIGIAMPILVVYNETTGTHSRFSFSHVSIDGANDRYAVSFQTEEIGPGLCFLTVEAESADRTVYSHRTGYDRLYFSYEGGYESERGLQLLLSEYLYDAPEAHYGGIIYQIFVDRFCRGRNTEIPDGMVFVRDWNSGELEYPAYPGAPMRNNTVYGGNLDGIREKLPYLASLGVSMLYLTPIFLSPSNHKYDTSDYLSVDPLFGDETDLSRLIAEGEAYGISVMLDGVFNHTGSDSIYFNKKGRFPSVGAYQSKKSPYYSWYRFRSFPQDYVSWWDIEILPRISPDEPSCRRFFVGKGGVIEKYAKMGIGGLRLDVADELSDAFISEIKAKLTECAPRSILYGEVWEDASNKIAYETRKQYFTGKELDGVMNYPLRRAILSYLRDADTDPFRQYVEEILPNTPQRILHAQMNLIGTHDTARAITALAGEASEGKLNAELLDLRMEGKQYQTGVAMIKQASVISATMPGIPMIYYGDEAGMQGYGDPFNRLPYPWGREDAELLAHYRALGKWRRDHGCYRTGEFRLISMTQDMLIFERSDSVTRALTFINRGETPSRTKIKCKKRDIFGGRIKNGALEVPAHGFAVLCMEK